MQMQPEGARRAKLRLLKSSIAEGRRDKRLKRLKGGALRRRRRRRRTLIEVKMVGVKKKKSRVCAPCKGKRPCGRPPSASSPPTNLIRPFCPAQPSFFKIMLDNFEEVLFIPPKLTNVFLGLVNQNVHLKDFNGNISTVKISMIDNSLAFKEGWKDFVFDHSIVTGEFLLFKYVSEAFFSVQIFGTSACERVDFDKKNDNTSSKVNISEADLSERSQFAKRRKITVASDAKKDSKEKPDPSNFATRPLEDACERVDSGKRNDGTFSEKNREKVNSPERSLFVKRHKLIVATNCKKASEEKDNPNSSKVLVQDSCERVDLGKRNDNNSSIKKRKLTDTSPERSKFSRQPNLAVASNSKKDSKENHVPMEDASERVGLGKRNDNNSFEKNRKETNLSPGRSQFYQRRELTVSSNSMKDLKERHCPLENACARVGFGKRNCNNSSKENRENTDLYPLTSPKAAYIKSETKNQIAYSQEIILDAVTCKFLLTEDGICHIVNEDSMNGLGAVKVAPCLSASEICTKIRCSDYDVNMSGDATSNHESVSNVTYVATVPIIDLKPEENSNKSGCSPSKEFSRLVGSVGSDLQEMPVTVATVGNACQSRTVSDVLPEEDKKEDDVPLLRSHDHEPQGVEPMNVSNLYSSSSCSFSFTSASNNQGWIELPQDLQFPMGRKMTVVNAVILRDPLLREWPILYYKSVDFAGFTSGWNDFAKANNLRQGSTCEFFQVADDLYPTFQVQITHPSL